MGFDEQYNQGKHSRTQPLRGNKKFGKNYNAERVALLALYHDTTEVITGDMPTPVKYYNDDIKNVYKDIESIAGKRLLDMLPDELKEDYKPLFEKKEEDIELWKLVKAADKISAQQKKIEEIDLKEVEYFRKNFLNSYYLTLDEHTK